MTSRRRAHLLVLALSVAVVALLVVETARAATPPAAARARQVVNAIGAEFGHGPTGACFWRIAWRESHLNPLAANRGDVNGGSYGALQINAVWRRPGETVDGFARRMFDPAQNARLAHRIFVRYGIAPWNGC